MSELDGDVKDNIPADMSAVKWYAPIPYPTTQYMTL